MNYQEQDIIIDPRNSKGEDIQTFFKKNEKKDDSLSKQIKANKKKIFDQDYDIEKCELIDLDKKYHNKIIDMIFDKKADTKYFEHIDKITKDGFIIEDDDLEESESKYYLF